MLSEDWTKTIRQKVARRLGITNPMAIPKVVKVVVNMRVPEGAQDRGAVEQPLTELAAITGQKPKVCPARRAISGFKLKKGAPIGLKVTLRRRRMYDFLERVFKIVLPRVRDFKGFTEEKFDGRGNFSFTIPEHTLFPEVNLDKVKKPRALEVTIVTSTDNDQEAKVLLEELGLPFKQRRE